MQPNPLAQLGTHWAILPSALGALEADAVAFTRDPRRPPIKPRSIDFDAIGASSRSSDGVVTAGKVAVVSVVGPMLHRTGWLETALGAVSTERLGIVIDALAADKSVEGIMLLIDSPGGSIAGLHEFAAKVRAAAGVKPVTAMVSTLAASAAYWIASQAREIVVTPSASVGSIGVIVIHENIQEMLKQEGIDVSILVSSASPRKAEGNPFEPMSKEARADTQAKLDGYYEQFAADVRRGRGGRLRDSTLGKGAMFTAQEAVRLGYADRIGTIGDVLAGMQSKTGPRAHTSRDAIMARLRYLDISARQHGAIERPDKPAPAPQGSTSRNQVMVRARMLELAHKESRRLQLVLGFAGVHGRHHAVSYRGGKTGIEKTRQGQHTLAPRIFAKINHKRTIDAEVSVTDDSYGLRVECWTDDEELLSALRQHGGIRMSYAQDTRDVVTEVTFCIGTTPGNDATAAILASRHNEIDYSGTRGVDATVQRLCSLARAHQTHKRAA